MRCLVGNSVISTLDEIINTQKTLTDITVEAFELSRLLIECGGELTPEIEARLEVNSQALLAKVDNYVAIEDQFEMQAAYFDRKAKVNQAIAKAYKGQIERLRSRIKETMKLIEKDVVMGNEYYYRLSKSAPKLVIDDESKIPTDFQMVVQTVKLDNEKIKSMLLEGFEIPGAHIEQNGTLKVFENSKR